MKATTLLICVLVILCVASAAWSWFLYKKLGQKETTAHYYETNEWCRHKEGVQFSQTDQDMDSLIYLPIRKQVCWFHGRVMADVQDNGTFVLKWPNGGRLSGVVNPLDKNIELVGLPGTAEDGVTEMMILSE